MHISHLAMAMALAGAAIASAACTLTTTTTTETSFTTITVKTETTTVFLSLASNATTPNYKGEEDDQSSFPDYFPATESTGPETMSQTISVPPPPCNNTIIDTDSYINISTFVATGLTMESATPTVETSYGSIIASASSSAKPYTGPTITASPSASTSSQDGGTVAFTAAVTSLVGSGVAASAVLESYHVGLAIALLMLF